MIPLPEMAIKYNKIPYHNKTIEYNKWLYAWEVMKEIHDINNGHGIV